MADSRWRYGFRVEIGPVGRELLTKNDDESFLDCLITCDEKWVFHDNTKAVRHWRLKGLLEGKKYQKPKRSIHCQKTMVLVFWDIHGVVHHEFLPKGRTINKEYYCCVLECGIESTRPSKRRGHFCGEWFSNRTTLDRILLK